MFQFIRFFNCGQNGNLRSKDECRLLNYSSKCTIIIRFQDVIITWKPAYVNHVAGVLLNAEKYRTNLWVSPSKAFKHSEWQRFFNTSSPKIWENWHHHTVKLKLCWLKPSFKNIYIKPYLKAQMRFFFRKK